MSRSHSLPLVVASVNSAEDLEALPSIDLEKTCHVVEFRLDGIVSAPSCSERISACKMPVILTARRPDEGAFSEIALPDRLRLLQSHLKENAYIDLECATLDDEADNSTLGDLLKQMIAKKCKLIASCHDFKSVPTEEIIDAKISIARQHDAIVKIACTVNSPSELCEWTNRLTQLLASGCPFSFMGMGKYGMATRLTAASAGSLLNYGYLHQPSVPGQWPAESLKQTLSLITE